MKKTLIAASAALIMSATSAHAAGGDFMKDVTYGAGLGSVDLGNVGSATLIYGIAEKPLDIKQLKDFDTSAQLRLGTSTNASSGGFELGIDYLISAMFKVSKQLEKKVSAYAMLGFSYASMTATTPAINLGFITVPSQSATTTDSSVGWGVGVDYEVNRDLTVGAEYAAYWSDVTALAVNAKFKF